MPINARFSSGLAASQSLGGILDRQKAEARQAMIDQLSQKNVESEIGARDENAKWMALQRQAMADKYKADEDQRQVNLLDNSGAGMDEDITGRFSPAIEGVGKEYGRIQNRMVPNPEGETPDTLDQHQFFTGTPKQHENRAIDQSIDETTPAMLDAVGPENRPLVEALIKSHKGTHTVVPPAEMAPFIKGTQSNDIFVTDRDGITHKGSPTGPAVDHVPAGAVVRQVPAEPSPANTQLQPEYGPDGKPTGRYFAYDPRNKSWSPVSGPGPERLKPTGSGAGGNGASVKPILDVTTARGLAALQAKAKTTGFRKDQDAYMSASYAAVNNSGADPGVKNIVSKIIHSYESGQADPRPTDEIIKSLTNQTTSEQEIQQLRTLLRAFRNEGPVEGQ